MKKLTLIIFLFFSASLFAGHGWQRINHMQSTIFSASVTVNGQQAKPGDVLGAFVNNECRMIAPIFLKNDSSYVSSVIHGDVPETVEFRLWVQEKDSILIVPKTITSKPGGDILLHKIIL